MVPRALTTPRAPAVTAVAGAAAAAMPAFFLAPAGYAAMEFDERTILKIGFFVWLIISLTFHEYGHAWSAKKLGDDTAERMGRLSLNPIVHVDLLFTIILPLMMLFGPLQNFIGICAAKPVPVNPYNLRKPTRDMMITSAAGPAMNVLLALFFTGALWFHTELRGVPMGKTSSISILTAIQLNLQLAFFNMLPIPPLDGHRVAGYFLPSRLREAYYRIGVGGGIMLLLLLLWTGVIGRLFESFLVPFGVWWGRLLMPGGLPIFGLGF